MLLEMKVTPKLLTLLSLLSLASLITLLPPLTLGGYPLDCYDQCNQNLVQHDSWDLAPNPLVPFRLRLASGWKDDYIVDGDDDDDDDEDDA